MKKKEKSRIFPYIIVNKETHNIEILTRIPRNIISQTLLLISMIILLFLCHILITQWSVVSDYSSLSNRLITGGLISIACMSILLIAYYSYTITSTKREVRNVFHGMNKKELEEFIIKISNENHNIHNFDEVQNIQEENNTTKFDDLHNFITSVPVDEPISMPKKIGLKLLSQEHKHVNFLGKNIHKEYESSLIHTINYDGYRAVILKGSKKSDRKALLSLGIGTTNIPLQENNNNEDGENNHNDLIIPMTLIVDRHSPQEMLLMRRDKLGEWNQSEEKVV